LLGFASNPTTGGEFGSTSDAFMKLLYRVN
jgi:hypothetical protein